MRRLRVPAVGIAALAVLALGAGSAPASTLGLTGKGSEAWVPAPTSVDSVEQL